MIGTAADYRQPHKAIDRVRRESKRDDKHRDGQRLYDNDPSQPVGAIQDERLRLTPQGGTHRDDSITSYGA